MNHSTPDNKKRNWEDRGSPIDSTSESKSLKMSSKEISDLTGKIDTLIERTCGMERTLETNTRTLEQLSADHKDVKEELDDYKQENRKLRELIQCMDGRLKRTEMEVDKLKEATIDLTLRSMKHNMIVTGIADPGLGQKEDCVQLATDFLLKNMKIEKKRLAKEIVVDVAHRLGRGPNRPMIIRFTTHSGRVAAMSFCGNLKGTNFFVRDQLPPEMSNKASALAPMFKELRAVATNKVKMVRDKLYCNGDEVDPQFSLNKIAVDVSDLSLEISVSAIKHSDYLTVKDTGLQAHTYPAKTVKDVKTVLAKIRTDPIVVNATHLIYAYIVKDPITGRTSKGYDDDREYGISKVLLDLLERVGYEGVLIISKHNGASRLADRNKTICKLAEGILGVQDEDMDEF